MSDRSGQNDADNSFAGISFEGVNAVPPQSGENGDTINLADVAYLDLGLATKIVKEIESQR